MATGIPTTTAAEPAAAAPAWPQHVDAWLALVADWRWAMDAQLRIVRVESLRPDQPLPMLDALLGHTPWDSPAFQLPVAQWRRHQRVLWAHKPFRGLELAWRLPGRRARWCAISGVPQFDARGHFAGYVGLAQDITARKRAEVALRETRAELDATLRALPDLMFEIDRHGVFHRVYTPDVGLLAAPADAIVGHNHRDLLPADVVAVGEAAMAEADRHGHARGYRYSLDLPMGRRWFELSVARKQAHGPGPARFVMLVRDITALKQREDELTELAFIDPLTGLANRRLLLDRIEQAVLRQQREPSWCALLFIDLDDFKQINDRHGHPAGDTVLQALGQRLRGSVRATDPVGRLAGDEFLALLTDIGQAPLRAQRVAMRTARVIVQAMAEPVPVRDHTVQPSCSVGVLLFRGCQSLPALLAQADELMYRAKDAGKGRVIVRWYGRGGPAAVPAPDL
ncbi:sensor domain-containing diguanylate cyclase [Tepidimonas aquatica]|uniref:Putative signaling protein n=1 Tax=Tepidimonas aquatica TaxID=247482 RepID=A0A554WMJ3_9BURK|nr:sensor domain-containing diguanylate cyclase [Tepidimonas aquatica]TSE24798.1 putative signaling protein [Tepidimonas aquatica]